MRTDDLLTLCSYSHAERGSAFERRSFLIGAVLAASLIILALVQYCTPSAEAFFPAKDAELGNIAKTSNRAGFPSLPILF
jgi:hypothetical protein